MTATATAKDETTTARLSRWAAGLAFERLSAEAVHQAKRFLLDSLGCALGGYLQHDVRIALEVLSGTAGKGPATVIGTGARMDPVTASLLNALMVRVMDYNDIYWKQDPSHPSDLIPAALACGERSGLDGRELIVGIVLGHEIEQRLCEAAFPGIRERGWHHATLTAFASPIVAGRMLRLTPERIQHAIGISGCRHLTLGAAVSGKLTMMKNTVDPMATQSGVLAALLAEKGYTGPEHVLDGKEGLVHCLGPEWRLGVLVEGLGESWRIAECGMKAYPTEALTHTPISAVLDLVREHDLRPEGIVEVRIRSLARAADILSDPSKYDPRTKETADHSLPYVIAAAIVDRQVTPAQFADARIQDPAIRAQLPKVKVVADPEIERLFPKLQRVIVAIRTTDGRELTRQVDFPKGDPRNPLADGEIEEKFGALASPVLDAGRRARVVEAVWGLEGLASITSLMDLVRACALEDDPMGQTAIEKIVQAHMAEGPTGRPVRAGDFLSIRPRHVMTHDNTSAVMKKFRSLGVPRVRDPRQPVFALDHDIQNTAEDNLKKYRAIEAFAAEQGVDFYPAGTGIGHQVMCEQLYVVPGSLVVASDSHSNMYGALSAVGTPIVRTDAAAAWATGEFWWQIPPMVQVVLEGGLAPGATGKDVIIALAGLYGSDVLNAAVEFAGPGVSSLSMDARMSIANMTTEWGALVGWFPADRVTLDWIRARRARGVERVTDAQIAAWERSPVSSDPDATYAARIRLDLSEVTPHVSGPDTVQVATPLAEIEEKRIAIQKAYLVSCVNARREDLEAAARVLDGKRIAPGVGFYLAAASREVQEEAERRGIWKTLVDAGAKPLPPGCGPCIGLGTGLLEPGEVGISATNRNFKGRMGSRDAKCYLASPEVVAASAVAGTIRGPGSTEGRRLTRRIERLAAPAPPAEKVAILDGFPDRLRGRLVLVPQDNLNTDGIYGKDYTYREDMTREEMARVVMENYDPGFSAATRAGDVLVGAFNFGTGSSREQAVTALQAKGIALVIAGSFSQTYLRNAFNNGLVCVEAPDLVRRLLGIFAAEIAAKTKTILPGDEVSVDFGSGALAYRGQTFRFPPLGSVPQALVVAGGVENLVRRRLGLA